MATNENHGFRRYVPGTVTIRSDGYTFVKTADGQKAEHRLIMEHRLGRDLEKGEKVMHLDNTLRGVDPKAFNDPKNLAVVRCRTTKWVKIKCRVLHVPKGATRYYPQYTRTAQAYPRKVGAAANA
jgi:hypothetical protein